MTWKETIAPDETTRFEAIASELRDLQKGRATAGHTPRGLHEKQHVGAVGEFVAGDVPVAMRVGPFQPGAKFPLYARFSNGAPAAQHDGTTDIRGFALKLVGVPGKKLIPGLEDKKTQDFLFIQSPSTPFASPDEFMTFLRHAAKGQALLLPRLVGALGFGRTLKLLKGLAGMPKVASYATSPFYSGAALRMGEGAARLALLPTATPDGSKASGSDGLREDLVRRLAAGPMVHRLCAQPYVDDTRTPIEDASVRWTEEASPFVELGRVTIFRQDVTSARGKEIHELVTKLSFDPWHAVPELRPLGAVMRARNVAYRESVIARKAADEPESVLASE
ncbi:MAG: hypothetical protein U0169_14040 [Polyangiaceae bacterium]